MRSAYHGLRIPIPELATSVRLRAWSCAERSHYKEEVADKPGAMAWVFAHSAADELGQREFSDADIPALRLKPYVLLERVYRASLEHNCILSEADLDARKQRLVDDYELRFWFLLAGHLKKTVGELQAAMSWDEFCYWFAYHQKHPIGDDLADIHNGMLRHAIACTIPRRRGRTAPKLKDCLVDWWKLGRQTQQQIVDTFNAFFGFLKNQHAQKRADIPPEKIGGR